MSLNDTPRGNRLHIGIFGKRNSGKSSLINAITGQETALVSEVAGTTTDPVYKSMEIHPIGPCVLIDTAGFDDEGTVGELRVERTREAALKTDVALIVFDGGDFKCSDACSAEDACLDNCTFEGKDYCSGKDAATVSGSNSGRDAGFDIEKQWISEFKKRKIPTIAILNKSDLISNINAAIEWIEKCVGIKPIAVSSRTKAGISQIHEAIMRSLPEDYGAETITGGIVNDGDVVLLVMPQDIQAPKGRLILPQVQTLRELLDRKCIVLSVTTDKLDEALKALSHPPAVIITDSQVFKTVYEKKPAESKLTSFSVLFAGYKGDLDYFTKSVAAIDSLTEDSRVLIAEACTHAPLSEDIGREKIPKMLRERVGEKLTIDVVSGNDFPRDLSRYDLIIHCGACMFNRRYVLSRIESAARQNVPMTNYGVAIAYLSGILDKISLK